MEILQQSAHISIRGLRKGDCPYCKTPLKGAIELVQCVKCKTLHHATCWNENGERCSIYGCENSIGTNYVVHQRHALLRVIYYFGIVAIVLVTFYAMAFVQANLLVPLLMVMIWGLWVVCFRFLCNSFIYCPKCSERITVSKVGIRFLPPDHCPRCNIAFL